MGDDPVGTLIGAVLIGLGSMLLFGAVKNRKVFGKDGLLASAISTGSLRPTSTPAYSIGGASVGNAVGSVIPGVVAGTKARIAIQKIGSGDAGWGQLLEKEFAKVKEGATRNDLITLSHLLNISEQRGYVSEVTDIRNYVEEVTGERI